jgi:hypothetical protein
VLGEVGGAVAVDAAPDRHGDTVRTRDGVVFEVDVEAVLGEQPAREWRWWLGPTSRVDVIVVEVLLELAGPIRRVAEHLRLVVVAASLSMRPSDLAGDTEPAVVSRFEVLAEHRGQQLGGQLSDELFTNGGVVPVTD